MSSLTVAIVLAATSIVLTIASIVEAATVLTRLDRSSFAIFSPAEQFALGDRNALSKDKEVSIVRLN
jgi:hypothetical protein